ncbi:hypothetical protein OIU79_024343 [Salix purpurea]|uniref:Uncharacterized protein n=1 Tax=Salix purpurea TaxID=77065 RepID=A0A9Q0WB83_SALPP|nr:hypothetical protein OIU79_024343 [Salix purpurea]
MNGFVCLVTFYKLSQILDLISSIPVPFFSLRQDCSAMSGWDPSASVCSILPQRLSISRRPILSNSSQLIGSVYVTVEIPVPCDEIVNGFQGCKI